MTMKIKLQCSGQPMHCVEDTLLGQNLEAVSSFITAMTSERFRNPKFAGPANPQTGIANCWQPYGNNMPGLHCELTSGMSLSGNESQLINNFSDAQGAGILQTGVCIRKGEVLEIELWAKVRHHPATLLLGIGPLCKSQEWYEMVHVQVDASYWKCYRITLAAAPCDDDEAVFWCLLEGEGYIWIDQIHLHPVGEDHLCTKLIDRIKTLQIPILRFPGGCISTNYHWRHGTGPVHLRPVLADPVFKFSTVYDFGTDEYLELCMNQGIHPHITVNVGSGTPEEAGEWAAYCASWFQQRGVEPPPAWFQIGNEQYGLWESSHMTGQMYVDALRAFVPPIRSAYPNCRIIALGEQLSQGLRQEQATEWRNPVLEQAAELVDVFAISRYKGQWYDTNLDKQINVVESVRKIKDDLEALIHDIRAKGLKHKVALTEWNYMLHACAWDGKDFLEPGDAQHGLFVAGMLNMFARLGADMELANFYHLVVGLAIFLRHGSEVVETCIADVFRMYRPAFPGEFVPIEVSSPLLGSEPAVDAICIRNEDTTWLFMANRHPSDSAHVELAGLPPKIKSTYLLSSESPLNQLVEQDMPILSNALHLPPLSIARLQYDTC